MNVLVIAPHPDDEAIGCGGSISLHLQRKDRVTTVFLTSGELGLKHLAREEAWRIREKEAQKAGRILQMAEVTFLRQPDWYLGDSVQEAAALLGPILERERPELVYLPHPQEWHPDHQACLPIVSAAYDRMKSPRPGFLGYEIWTPLSTYDHVEDITAVMKLKLRAIRAYRSQLIEFRYDRAVSGLNQYRGTMAGKCDFAEVFQTLDAGGSH
jgi:N-acetylglucosamine malate deacetylase 1